MVSILLPCRTFTVVFRCLISFLQHVSYSELTHSLHCYLHGVILLPYHTFTVILRCLISFLQHVSYSEHTHSLHCYLHAVYSLTLSYLHCHILMLNFIPSVGKLSLDWLTLCSVTYMLSILLPCRAFTVVFTPCQYYIIATVIALLAIVSASVMIKWMPGKII